VHASQPRHLAGFVEPLASDLHRHFGDYMQLYTQRQPNVLLQRFRQSLGIELRRVGSGRRMTFGPGEQALDDWLERSARIAWMVCDEPWKTEEYLIRTVSLPLNLDQNRHHLFHSA
jgi:hypothetical protein